MKYLSIFIRVALLALGQSLNCHSASEVGLMDMGKSVNVYTQQSTANQKPRAYFLGYTVVLVLFFGFPLTNWWCRVNAFRLENNRLIIIHTLTQPVLILLKKHENIKYVWICSALRWWGKWYPCLPRNRHVHVYSIQWIPWLLIALPGHTKNQDIIIQMWITCMWCMISCLWNVFTLTILLYSYTNIQINCFLVCLIINFPKLLMFTNTVPEMHPHNMCMYVSKEQPVDKKL